MAELVADIIGIRVFGPAYFCAFAFLALTDDNPGRYSETHPSLSKRMQLLYEELKEMGVLSGATKETVDGYYQMVISRAPIGADSADTDYSWSDVFNKCREAVLRHSDQLRIYTNDDRQNSEYLAKSLSVGIPIGSSLDENSRQSINNETKNLLTELHGLPDSPNQDLHTLRLKFDEIIKMFVEQPTHPVWVINAGWLFRWTALREYCSRVEIPSNWFSIINPKDVILKKSIEAIPIHQSLKGLLNAT